MLKFSPKKYPKLKEFISKKLLKDNSSSKKDHNQNQLNYSEMVHNFELKIKKN